MTNKTNTQTIRLTERQTYKLNYENNLRIRIKRKHKVYYVERIKDNYVLTDWSGKELNFNVVGFWELNE